MGYNVCVYVGPSGGTVTLTLMLTKACDIKVECSITQLLWISSSQFLHIQQMFS